MLFKGLLIFLKPPHRLQIEKNLPRISFPKGSSMFKIYAAVFTSNFDGLHFLNLLVFLIFFIWYSSFAWGLKHLYLKRTKIYKKFGQNSSKQQYGISKQQCGIFRPRFCKTTITWYLQWARSMFGGLSCSSPSTPQFLALMHLPSAFEQTSTHSVACTTPARSALVQGQLKTVGSHGVAQRACSHLSSSCIKSKAVYIFLNSQLNRQ